jgi:hypothetical protein
MPFRSSARVLILGALLLLVLAATVASAGATSFKASVAGQQELTWSVDGTSGSCETRHGAGSGTVSFKFRSLKPGTAAATKHGNGLSFSSSMPSKATGSIAGTFTDSVATACPGFEPRPTFTEEASGCGATTFGVRVDASAHGAFIYVNGPNVPLGPVSTSASGPCPFLSSLSSTDFAICGDGNKIWQRSWAFGAAGAGLAVSKIAVKPSKLLKPKKKTTLLTGRSRVDCTMPSQYTDGIKIALDLKYTITLKKIG